MSTKVFRLTLLSLLVYAFFTVPCFLTLPWPLNPGPCLSAVEIHPNAGTTSATFLKYGAGSRAISMAGAFTGLSDDMTAMYWNPAGLVRLKRNEFNISHNEGFEGVRHDFLGYAHILPESVLAASTYGLYTEKDFERRSGLYEDDPFEPLTPVEGYFRTYDVAFHAAYSKWFRENISYGIGAKVIQQTIDSDSAYGIAADLGTLYVFDAYPLTVGFVLQNIGTPIKFDEEGYYPPFTVKAGGAYTWNEKILTTLDIYKPIDNFFFIACGAEYTPVKFLRLRAGYKYRQNGQELDDLSGLSAGMGFDFNISGYDLRFDYAFSPYGVLGNSQRFSLTVFLNDTAKPKTLVPMPETEKKLIQRNEPVIHEPPHTDAPVYKATLSEGQSVHNAQVSGRLRMLKGQMPIHSVVITSTGSILCEIEAMAKAPSLSGFDFDIVETADSKHNSVNIEYRQSMELALYNAECTICIPAAWKDVTVRSKDNIEVQKELVTKNEAYVYYSFRMRFLEPFSVTYNEANKSSDASGKHE